MWNVAFDLGLDKKQKAIVTILLLGTFMVVLNQTLLSPAFPAMMVEYGIDATTVQWLTSGYSLVEAVVVPLSAFFVGRFPVRKLFLGGFSSFFIGTLLAAWAPVFPVLLLGRVYQAFATGIVMPMTMTLILLIFPREKRGAGMGLVSLIIGFAPTLGPTLSGFLIDTVGWHMMFVIIACIAVAVLVVGFFKLSNYGEFDEAPFDVPSVALSSLGLLCMLYGFSTFSTTDNIIATLALIAVGVVLMGFFVSRQLKLETPILKVDILKSRRFAVSVLTAGIIQGTSVANSVILPIFVQQVLGYSATVSGLVVLPGALLGAFMALASGRLFDRLGMRRIAVPGAFAMFLGVLGLAIMGPTVDVLVVTLFNLIFALGMQALLTPLNTWGVNSLSNHVIQHANAVSSTVGQVFISFGTALVVSMTAMSSLFAPNAAVADQLYIGEHIGFICVAILILLALLSVLFLARDRESDKKTIEETKREQEMAARAAGAAPMVRTKHVMDANPHFIPQTASIRETIEVFSECETSGVPVVDDTHHVVGFVSDGDLMKYLGRNDATLITPMSARFQLADDDDLARRVDSLLNMDVNRIATMGKVITVDADTPIDEACRVLADRRIKKLPVVKDGKLVGTLSRRNVIRAIEENASIGQVSS